MDMKVFKYFLTPLAVILIATACKDSYLDPITKIEPGSDSASPVVTITSPLEGYAIEVDSLTASVLIQYEVTDDIELGSISVLMDGAEIQKLSSFKDYRRAVQQFRYKNVATGSHVLTIKATDLQGKLTTKVVNFIKKPPYVALYSGEIFYMPFNGDFIEKLSFREATKTGSPGFTDNSLKGSKAYAGAADSYLTFPVSMLNNPAEFSAAFWYKVNGSPDRSGILNASPAGEDRTKGFRLFREGSASKQRIKLNVGTGTGETWNDGQEIAAPASNWVHVAFTISKTKAIIYINGAVAGEVPNTGLDWTGCSVLTIGSGAPNFTYWNHKYDLSQYDELRLFNKALSSDEIQTMIQNDKPYVPREGEMYYWSFENNYKDLIKKTEAAKVGTPGFAAGKIGKAFAGAANSYLTIPITEVAKSNTFSATFWYKVNPSPDRSGILNASPAGEDRTKGFRLFREGSATSQQIKVNVGTGTGETWNDGDFLVAPATDWVHIALTISGSKATIYFNGAVAREVDNKGLDWTGCSVLTIGSGAPNFTYWSHGADLSLYDELHLYSKALTQAEIQAIWNAEK
jgi:hypothetical protein